MTLLLVLACASSADSADSADSAGADTADTDSDTADTGTDTADTADTDTADTDTDTGGADPLAGCDGVSDPGYYATDSTTTFTAAYDDSSPMYDFEPADAVDWSLTASAGVSVLDGTHWSVNLPAENWAVLLEYQRDSTTYYRTWLSGWGAGPTEASVRAYRRDDWASRMAQAGWSEGGATGILGIHAVDEAGVPLLGATVRVADGSYTHAFSWTSAELRDELGQLVWTHIPQESSSLQTYDGSLFFTGVCPGMNEVEVDGPCGPCTLGRAGDSPTRAPVLVEADTVSLAWWTCDTSCE